MLGNCCKIKVDIDVLIMKRCSNMLLGDQSHLQNMYSVIAFVNYKYVRCRNNWSQ